MFFFPLWRELCALFFKNSPPWLSLACKPLRTSPSIARQGGVRSRRRSSWYTFEQLVGYVPSVLTPEHLCFCCGPKWHHWNQRVFGNRPRDQCRGRLFLHSVSCLVGKGDPSPCTLRHQERVVGSRVCAIIASEMAFFFAASLIFPSSLSKSIICSWDFHLRPLTGRLVITNHLAVTDCGGLFCYGKCGTDCLGDPIWPREFGI